MPDADKTWTIDSFTAQQNNSHAHSVYLQHHIHTSKSSQAQPTPLLASGKWNKIKQNCLNTPASAAQSESVHLDFCWIFQMVNSGMLEKVIFYLSFFFIFYMPALISISWKERSQELLELTQSPLSGPLMSVISIRKFLKQLKISTTHMFSWYICQSIRHSWSPGDPSH